MALVPTTMLALLLLAFTAGAADAQQVRGWPSREAAAGPAEDPPMGRGGECRHEGRRIAQGETACIGRAGDRRLARCDMVLNNTSWIDEEPDCPAE